MLSQIERAKPSGYLLCAFIVPYRLIGPCKCYLALFPVILSGGHLIPEDKFHELPTTPIKSDRGICDDFLDNENKARVSYHTVHKMMT